MCGLKAIMLMDCFNLLACDHREGETQMLRDSICSHSIYWQEASLQLNPVKHPQNWPCASDWKLLNLIRCFMMLELILLSA